MSYKLAVKPYGAVVYQADRKRSSNLLNSRFQANKNNMSPGVLSSNARRKIISAIRWLSIAAEEKKGYDKKNKRWGYWSVNELTFTFQENMQDDRLAREILGKWFEMAKYRFALRNYIWKAEPQERGAIHFHAVTDTYIPHQELRYTWNRLLRKHGLGNLKNNSTDVHGVFAVKNLVAYLTNYLVNDKKHEGRRAIKGKLWGCSHALSQAGKSFVLIDEHEKLATRDEWKEYDLANIISKQGKTPAPGLAFIDVYHLPPKFFDSLPPCELKSIYQDEIAKLRHSDFKQKQLFPSAL